MPRWYETVNLRDIFYDETISYESRRNKIVEKIKASRWYKLSGSDSWLHEVVDELRDSGTNREFNRWWSAFYDIADEDRIWIAIV